LKNLEFKGDYIMTKAELVKEISNRTSMTQKDVASVIDVLPEVFKDTVAKDEKINLVGFMTVSKKHIPTKSGETSFWLEQN
jgi:nucleoid DNA-binding protein